MACASRVAAGLLVAAAVVAGDSATTAKGIRQLGDAINFAIAKVSSDGTLLSTKTRWGLEAVSSLTCAPTPESYTVPAASEAVGALRDVLESGVLQVAALGPSNWGIDGNYLVSPPVGFWPDYVDAVAAALASKYLLPRVLVNRTFHTSSNGVLAAVAAGNAHVSEPYFNLGGFYGGKPRGVALTASCSVLGYDSTFFVNASTAATTVQALQALLRADESRAVGVHSEGDWHSVQPAVPAGTPHVVIPGTVDLAEAVQSGRVFAGMVSGAPNSTYGFQSFSSNIVSVRAFLMPPPPSIVPQCSPGPADGAAAAGLQLGVPALVAAAVAAALRRR